MKILFLTANPVPTSRLRLGEEALKMEENLRRLRLSERLQLISRWEISPQNLRRALLEENPNIVHFSGHGTGQEGLVFVDNAGESKPATGQALAGLFALFPNVRCVLLNACYSVEQAQAIVKHTDYVIGMKDTILDNAAIAFTIGFYESLCYGRTIEDAFDFGCNSILWEISAFSDKTRQGIPIEHNKENSSESLPEYLKPILLKKNLSVNQEIITPPLIDISIIIQKCKDQIKEHLANDTLTPFARDELETFLAKKLNISESEAKEKLIAQIQDIKQAEIEYENLYIETIKEKYDLSYQKIQNQCKKKQKNLELTERQVLRIEKKVLDEIRKSYQEKQQSETSKVVGNTKIMKEKEKLSERGSRYLL